MRACRGCQGACPTLNSPRTGDDGGHVTGYIEVWSAGSHHLMPLDAAVATIGRADSSDIALADPTVSRLHAIVERYSSGWSIRDVGSANGTRVNGERITGERRLLPEDEIGIGSARLFLRLHDIRASTLTLGSEEPPELTPTERRVLLALCRPLLEGQTFPEPATVRSLSEAFVVSEAAIRQHLLRLYDKFGIQTGEGSRRARLANEAMRRRAVSLAELKKPET